MLHSSLANTRVRWDEKADLTALRSHYLVDVLTGAGPTRLPANGQNSSCSAENQAKTCQAPRPRSVPVLGTEALTTDRRSPLAVPRVYVINATKAGLHPAPERSYAHAVARRTRCSLSEKMRLGLHGIETGGRPEAEASTPSPTSEHQRRAGIPASSLSIHLATLECEPPFPQFFLQNTQRFRTNAVDCK